MMKWKNVVYIILIAIIVLLFLGFFYAFGMGIVGMGRGSYLADSCIFKDEGTSLGITCSKENFIIQNKEEATAILELKNDFDTGIYVFDGKIENLDDYLDSLGQCRLFFDENKNFFIDEEDKIIFNEPILWAQGELKTLIVGCDNAKILEEESRFKFTINFKYYPQNSNQDLSKEIVGEVFSRVGGNVYSEYTTTCEKHQARFWYDLCLMRLKDKTHDTCDMIENEEFKLRCHEVVYQEEDRDIRGKAKRTGNYELCEQVHGDKKLCYIDVFSDYSNERICDNIQQTEVSDLCYRFAASNKEDIELCLKIQDDSQRGTREWCYSVTAKNPEDIKFCEQIKDTSWKGECYQNIAGENNDPSLCEKQTDSYKADRCFENIALAIKNSALCDKVNTRQDVCYKDVAIASKDATICEKITDEWMKNYCYSEIG